MITEIDSRTHNVYGNKAYLIKDTENDTAVFEVYEKDRLILTEFHDFGIYLTTEDLKEMLRIAEEG